MKFKRKSQMFMNGTKIEMKHIIMGLCNGKWMPYGEDKDILKYDTKEERDAKLTELKALVAAQAVD